MKRLFLAASISLILSPLLFAQAPSQQELEQVYAQWRQSMVNKDARKWSQMTSSRRKLDLQNRLLSERKPFPATLFQLPVAPPDLRGLTPARFQARGQTATAVYFGKVDFGVGGAPTENLLVLSFVQEKGWKYDGAEFINLLALPDIRAALAKKDFSVLDKPEFTPSGKSPQLPAIRLSAPVKYIAKVFCYCPGREVTVQVNRRSRHVLANTQAAEVVIGGAVDGENVVEYKVKNLPGSTGKEPIAIRVFLMSEAPGVKVPAVYSYVVEEGGAVNTTGQGSFTVDAAVAAKLRR